MGAVVAALGAAASARAGEFDAWVPAGWKLTHTARGDLDRDQGADAVLVVQQDDPAQRRTNTGLGAQELDLNPRRLLVLLKGPAGFRLVATGDAIVPPAHVEDAPCQEDPLAEGGLRVRGGVLAVRLHHWASCGSWGTATDEYKFRWMAGRLRLVGLDHTEFMRNSGEKSEFSVNFLSGRARSTTGLNEFHPARPKTVWLRLEGRRVFHLDEALPACQGNDARRVGRCE